MNIKQLRQRDADLKAQVAKAKRDRAAIGEKAIAENRAMAEDERTQFTAAKAEIDRLEALVEENGQLLAAAEDALEAERQIEVVPPDPDAQAGAQAAQAAGVRGRAEVIDNTKRPGFFGRQLQAIRNYVVNGGMSQISGEDRTVLQPMLAGPTGMNSNVPAEGGFLVAQERATTVLQRAYQTGQILGRLVPLPIGPGSNGMKLPAIDETSRADSSRYGGIVSGWLGQGGTLTAGKPKFREIDLKLRKVGAFVYATDELLGDAVALEGWINKYLPLELAFRVENAVVNGTGANQPLGVLNSGALVSVTRNTANRVLSEDLRSMWKRMWAPARANAVWLIDQSVEDEFDQLAIPVGTGGVLDPSYKPAGSVPGQPFATYKGRPIIPVEHMAALGTAGDIVLWSPDDYVLIDKDGVQSAVSIHVQFLADESVFRFIYRVDGQPLSNGTLTPKSGGDALTSCAVALT